MAAADSTVEVAVVIVRQVLLALVEDLVLRSRTVALLVKARCHSNYVPTTYAFLPILLSFLALLSAVLVDIVGGLGYRTSSAHCCCGHSSTGDQDSEGDRVRHVGFTLCGLFGKALSSAMEQVERKGMDVLKTLSWDLVLFWKEIWDK
jgi:hypothetical protein